MKWTRLAKSFAVTAVAGVALVATGCAPEPPGPPAPASASAAAGNDGASPAPGQGDHVAAPQEGPKLAAGAGRYRMHVASGGPAAPYNYAPSVMSDGNVTKMWWCSQLPGAGPAGDDVLYATAPSPDGPFHGPGGGFGAAVFTGSGTDFDAVHTCDPSVLRVNGTYYLYYTGSAGDRAHGNAIGVATSSDGLHWTRANGGHAVVYPSMGQSRDNTYGVGQPSVLYLDGWFYLMYTDTSNRSAGWNGAGQFVLRAKDPTFTSAVEGLSDRGFIDSDLITPGNAKSIVDAFSADWMFSDALNAFAVAHETETGTTITFFDRNLDAQPYQPVVLTGPWQEGPGLIRTPEGHAPTAPGNPCGAVPLDVIRATAKSPAPTDLAHFGMTVSGVHGCQTTEQAMELLRGYGVISPQRTVDIVVDGGVVRVDRRSVAVALATEVLDSSFAALDNVPVVARLSPSMPAVTAPGRGIGIILSDNKLWPVSGQQVAQLNSSALSTLTPAQWDSYPRGADLSQLRHTG